MCYHFVTQGFKYRCILLGEQPDHEIQARVDVFKEVMNRPVDGLFVWFANILDDIRSISAFESNWEAIIQYGIHLLETEQLDSHQELHIQIALGITFEQQALGVKRLVREHHPADLFEAQLAQYLKGVYSLPYLVRFTKIKRFWLERFNVTFKRNIGSNLCLFLNQVVHCFNATVDDLNVNDPLLENDTVNRCRQNYATSFDEDLLLFYAILEQGVRTESDLAINLICALTSQLRDGLLLGRTSGRTACIYDSCNHCFAVLESRTIRSRTIAHFKSC